MAAAAGICRAALALGDAPREIQVRHIGNCLKADSAFGKGMADALSMALCQRRPVKKVLHHSDRGNQYASKEYQEILKDAGITCSMSRKVNWKVVTNTLTHRASMVFP